MTNPGRSVSRFDFDPTACRYDGWYETPTGRLWDKLEKRATAKVLPRAQRGARLLDVGCGTGHWSAFFSGRGFDVTGVDISEAMIAVARSKSIANASFQVADAHALPFGDDAFQATAAITTLEFVADAGTVLREMARCTTPGRVMVLGILNALAPLNKTRKASGELPYAAARFFTPDEVRGLLEPYGPTEVKAVGCVPRTAWLRRLASLADLVCRLVPRSRGAFIVGRVRR